MKRKIANVPPPPPCQACGTWTCSACGWARQRAALDRPGKQDCARCGGTAGTFTATRHYLHRVWQDHNPPHGPRCAGWYWDGDPGTYVPGLPCEHPSCKFIAWWDV